jgi:oxygen-independent coproporphyrinogen III oxidase
LAGLYVHIPFCKRACHYCNFHFSTALALKNDVLLALQKELALQQNYLGEKAPLQTIYLGGGTPSLLTIAEINALFEAIYRYFDVAADAEITIEANPDDLSWSYLHELRNHTPINRLSIGIQSFVEEDLRFMNRAHNAIEAKASIEYAQDAGFEQISVDLIYGSPTTDDKQWRKNLRTVFGYNIPHVSCYCLTVEPKTALYNFVAQGKMPPVDEEKAARHFNLMLREMQRHGYIQYEISNFCLPNRFAQHNSNYWLGVPYLGIGPSAHSFNGTQRQHNVAHNPRYLEAVLQKNELPATLEILDNDQQYNEYVLTTMRTIWGCDPKVIAERFGTDLLRHFNQQVIPFVQRKVVETDGKRYFLTAKGRLIADAIAVDLFA